MYSFSKNVVSYSHVTCAKDHLDKSLMETLLPCFKLFMKAFGTSQKTIGLIYTITSRLKNNHMLPSTLISSTMIYCSIFKLHKFHLNNNNNYFFIQKTNARNTHPIDLKHMPKFSKHFRIKYVFWTT